MRYNYLVIVISQMSWHLTVLGHPQIQRWLQVTCDFCIVFGSINDGEYIFTEQTTPFNMAGGIPGNLRHYKWQYKTTCIEHVCAIYHHKRLGHNISVDVPILISSTFPKCWFIMISNKATYINWLFWNNNLCFIRWSHVGLLPFTRLSQCGLWQH